MKIAPTNEVRFAAPSGGGNSVRGRRRADGTTGDRPQTFGRGVSKLVVKGVLAFTVAAVPLDVALMAMVS
jgi:hypothetical protein